MTDSFVKALEENGFKYVDKVSKTTHDTYTIRGNDVYFNWKNIGQPSLASKIVFCTKGGSKIESLSGTWGEKLIPPENPEKRGHVFIGWEPELPERYPEGELTVKAIWTAKTAAPCLPFTLCENE